MASAYKDSDSVVLPNDVYGSNLKAFWENPEVVPGYTEWKSQPWIVLDLLKPEVLFGGEFDDVDDYLNDKFGDDASLRYQIVELSK